MGIYFFLKGLKNNKFFIWSALFLGITMFTLPLAKLITPVVSLGLLVIFRKKLLKINLKKLIIPFVLSFFNFLGALLYTFKMGGGSRITERSIAQGALDEGFTERIVTIAKGENPRIAKIIHNKYQVIAGNFINNYEQYFSYKFLVSGGAEDTEITEMMPGIERFIY